MVPSKPIYKHVTWWDMAADIFTKALDRLKVQKCAKMLGLGTIQDSGDMH